MEVKTSVDWGSQEGSSVQLPSRDRAPSTVLDSAEAGRQAGRQAAAGRQARREHSLASKAANVEIS
jgi:hypothetical protein